MIQLLFPLMMSPVLASEPIHAMLDAEVMDRSADPCQNFYQFSCGGWLKKFKLPPDKSKYWLQANALTDHVEENLNSLLVKLTKTPAAKRTAAETKVADFYQSCRVARKDVKAGLKELNATLADLGKTETKEALADRLAELERVGVSVFFDIGHEQDPKDSASEIAGLDRGGLSLPDPDYYLKDDAKSVEIREKYRKHIAKVFTLLKRPAKEADAIATRILAFETDLAGHALKKDDRRDIAKLYHPMTYAQVKALMPHFDWDHFLAALPTGVPAKWDVAEPEFLKHVDARLGELKPNEIADLLRYKMAERGAPYVSGPLRTESFAFWHQYLQGQKAMPPDWKGCTQVVAGNMGEALGQAYVASVPESAHIRELTKGIFEAIREEFKLNLDTLTWMDNASREAAKKKLVKMGSKIGWPDKWRDYSSLEVKPTQFFENELAATRFETKRGLAKIGHPTDRTEWDMPVWEANAYYAPSNNEMALPLGELVPPIFDPKFGDGANFGNLGGSTIGHELTHGFDDSGKDMDADGNYVTWWTPAVKEKFEQQTACFIKQTEDYDIIPGSKLRIRGKASLGENLADNGGMKMGIHALKKRMANRAPAKEFAGYNEVQQFFLAYAQGWCEKITDEKLREALLTDFHPPAEFRVNVVLANRPEFAEAFQCKAGAKMAPVNRCSIW